MWYKKSKNKFNISISGWRAVFNTIDNTTSFTVEDLMVFYGAMHAYIKVQEEIFKQSADEISTLRIAIGRDTRPSGIILSELAHLKLATHNIEIIDLHIIPLPVIMAYTKNNTDGFIYVTASHNPPEYNGIKFGSKEGKIHTHKEYKKMIQIFYDYGDDHPNINTTVRKVWEKFRTPQTFDFQKMQIIEETEVYTQACKEYKTLIYSGVFRGIGHPIEEIKTRLKTLLEQYNTLHNTHKTSLGIVLDPNGGARTCTIDQKILEELGIHTKRINTIPGEFQHAIIPEGESLSQASEILNALNKDDTTYWLLAIVCDCDGDRGNLVFSDESISNNAPLSLQAQEVFALVLKIELAWERHVHTGNSNDAPLAVAINGPSSLRCNIIADEYNAKVFRSEVGEANVVALSEILRSQHYTVPIIGEGSNGGIIIPPSNVRDPLCTILSILKSLLWHQELHLENNIHKIIKMLPTSISSTTEDPKAKVTLPNEHYSTIIQKIIKNFKEYVAYFYEILEANHIHAQDYVFVNFTGTKTILLDTENPKLVIGGGLAVHFYDKSYSPSQNPIAFLWLRPSGTEPVVRITVDVLHNNTTILQQYLLEAWGDYLEEVLFLKA